MKIKLVAIFTFCGLVAMAQWINPQINNVKSKTNTMGGVSLPDFTAKNNLRAIGDYNGDGLDDIATIMYIPTGPSTGYKVFRLFTANGDGNFTLAYTIGSQSSCELIPIINNI